MTGLEHRALRTDVAGRRHAEPAHEAGGKVGEDIAVHVLGHHHVEARGMLDEVERGSVDIAVARHAAREQPGALVEDAAEEHHGAQHIDLVDARKHAGPRAEEHTSDIQSHMRHWYAAVWLTMNNI